VGGFLINKANNISLGVNDSLYTIKKEINCMDKPSLKKLIMLTVFY